MVDWVNTRSNKVSEKVILRGAGDIDSIDNKHNNNETASSGTSIVQLNESKDDAGLDLTLVTTSPTTSSNIVFSYDEDYNNNNNNNRNEEDRYNMKVKRGNNNNNNNNK